MMRHVDLCSGIGGFALGFEWAGLSKPVLFCDIEPWSRKILAKHWPDVPIEKDVKELALDPKRLVPDCDILTAGYPCQPFSVAGQRRGTEDDRHIWPHILSIIQAKRPAWCVFENVSGHISLGLDEVLSDLESKANYAVQTFHLGAVSCDAPHRRMRLWIIARNVGDTDSKQRRTTKKDRGLDMDRSVLDRSQGREKADTAQRSGGNVADAESLLSNGGAKHTQQSKRQEPKLRNGGSSDDVAHADSQRGRSGNAERQDAEAVRQSSRGPRNNSRGMETWNPEPRICRVSHGVPNRVDRLRGLGNAIVPQIAQRIGQVIKQCEADE